MGYTKGRRLTDEFIISEAKKYKTKKEMKQKDPSIVATARRRGLTDKIYEHITNTSFSTPQLIVKKILENILQKKCLYNTRAIIKPYELDVYFEEYKLAFEYNGNRWHQQEETIKRDLIKKELCKKAGITLIVLNLNSLQYEQDIKQQLIKNLKTINKVTKNNFIPHNINSVVCDNLYVDIPFIKDKEELKRKINECRTIKEFRKKYRNEYHYLMKSKQLSMLDSLRKRQPKLTQEEIINLCKNVYSYNDLITKHFWLYLRCKRFNILQEATKHMIKTKSIYTYYTDEELIKLVPSTCKCKAELTRHNLGLKNELIRRNLLSALNFSNSRNRFPLKQYTYLKSKEYFVEKILPLINDGYSINKIYKNKKLLLSTKTLKQSLYTHGTKEDIEKEATNCRNNTLNGLALSPTRIKK